MTRRELKELYGEYRKHYRYILLNKLDPDSDTTIYYYSALAKYGQTAWDNAAKMFASKAWIVEYRWYASTYNHYRFTDIGRFNYQDDHLVYPYCFILPCIECAEYWGSTCSAACDIRDIPF